MKTRQTKTADAFRSTEDKYRTIFDLAPDMIWIRGWNDARLLDVNAGALRKLGYRREEMIGKPAYDFYFNSQDKKVCLELARQVEKAGQCNAHITFRTREGRPLEVELRGSRIDVEGRKGILIIARDVAEELKEERRTRVFFEAFRRSKDAMFYCDRNGIILDVNDAFTQIYGFAREEAIGQTPRIVKSPHSSREFYERMWAQILDPARGYWKGQIINCAKNGREIPVVLMIIAVRDASGDIANYFSIATDVSEQVALQARLAQSEALAQLGEMAAAVAHEIRNPLGSIVMAAKQLSQGDLAREDRDMVLQILRNESQRLNGTLTNFLAYSRPHDLKLDRADVNALIEEVCHLVLTDPSLSKGLRVEKKLDPVLETFPLDPEQIRQVFWNILLNAVQAVGGKGRVTVESGRTPGDVFFRVTDTGPGIPQDLLPDIFKPFRTSKPQGTGLGLAIADRIVKAHGGRIDVESRVGKGTAFTVHLPAVQG